MTTFANVLIQEVLAETLLDSGTDDTSTAAAFLTDSTASWATDEFVGKTIKNVTDGSSAVITSNTATTIVGILSGGSGNDWDSGDAYQVVTIGQFTGVAPDGTDSEESIKRGRIRKWLDGSVGGLFEGNEARGVNLMSVVWNIPAASTPTITISLVDDDGFEYPIYSEVAESGYFLTTGRGILVPPEWTIKITSSLANNADGRVQITQGAGMSTFVGSSFGPLGEERPLPGAS